MKEVLKRIAMHDDVEIAFMLHEIIGRKRIFNVAMAIYKIAIMEALESQKAI